MYFLLSLKVVEKHAFHQAVQKRAWFDRLTMTTMKPVLSLPKEGAQRSMQTPSSPFELLRINSSGDGRFSTAC